jgi:hypothetical protein
MIGSLITGAALVIHDPIGLAESAVIVGCLAFDGWWFSPHQRRARLRDQARARMRMRRAFGEATDRTGMPLPRRCPCPTTRTSHDGRGRHAAVARGHG